MTDEMSSNCFCFLLTVLTFQDYWFAQINLSWMLRFILFFVLIVMSENSNIHDIAQYFGKLRTNLFCVIQQTRCGMSSILHISYGKTHSNMIHLSLWMQILLSSNHVKILKAKRHFFYKLVTSSIIMSWVKRNIL